MNAKAFASAADTAEQKARLVELGRNVYGYISDFDPNTGFVVGDDGVLLIDTRATPRMGREWIKDIRTVTDKPIRYVFLTHYHAVRVLGAAAYPEAVVIASNGTADLIAERGAADWESEYRRFPRLFQGAEEIKSLTRPQICFEEHLTVDLGGRKVELMHLGRGHSRGDSICVIPDANVVFSGDLVENRCGVYAGDGYLHDWVKTLDRLRALRLSTLVPGRGAAVQSRQEASEAISATQDFILSVLGCVERAMAKGLDLKGCHAAAERELSPKFGNWPIFTHVLAFDVSRAIDELNGHEHPAIWTAERDAAVWKTLNG